jgi:hypothetical protein
MFFSMNLFDFHSVPIQRNFGPFPINYLCSLDSCLLDRCNIVSIFRPESDVSSENIPVNDVYHPFCFKNLLTKFTIS